MVHSSSRVRRGSRASYTSETDSNASSRSNSPSLTKRSFESRNSMANSLVSTYSQPGADMAGEGSMCKRTESGRSSSGLSRRAEESEHGKGSDGSSRTTDDMHLDSFFASSASRSESRTGKQLLSAVSRNSVIEPPEAVEGGGAYSRNGSGSSGMTKEVFSSKSSLPSNADEGESSETQQSSTHSADQIDRACAKYGLSCETIEDILSGRRHSQTSASSPSRSRRRSEASDTSSDGFREEMLIYLLKEQIKLKAKLKAQRNREHGQQSELGAPKAHSTKGVSGHRRGGDPVSGKTYKELNELTAEEMRCLEEVWDDELLCESDDGVVYKVRGRQTSKPRDVTGPSAEPRSRHRTPSRRGALSPEMGARSRVMDLAELQPDLTDAEYDSNAPMVVSRETSGMVMDDLEISQEANSLQDEIEQIIEGLESTGVTNHSGTVGQRDYEDFLEQMEDDVGVVPPYVHGQSQAVRGQEEDVAVPVLPIKVPIKAAKPDVFDAQVMTDETARENELRAYERLTRELERERFDSQMAHQTDNTRITKDGISWEITESYLKEEERRLLQEKKRAELLRQLKEPPNSRSSTLQDHYNQWVAKKAAAPVRPEARPKSESENEGSGASDYTPRMNTGGTPANHRNVFRRTRGNMRVPQEANTTAGQAPDQAPPHAGGPCPEDYDQSRREVYIKGSWDPRTGAVRISNDLDSARNVDKNQLLDDYVNFLKQSPGNWSQEDAPQGEAYPPARVTAAPPAEPPSSDQPVVQRPERGDAASDEQRFDVSNTADSTDSTPDSSNSTPDSSRQATSSDGSHDLYDRDEFYPPSGPLPADPSYAGGAPDFQHHRYAMGFRDLYVPPVRSAADLYSSSMARLSLMQGARAAGSQDEQAHHHYHYHCSDRRHRRSCAHRRRHTCRHGHRHECSRRNGPREQEVPEAVHHYKGSEHGGGVRHEPVDPTVPLPVGRDVPVPGVCTSACPDRLPVKPSTACHTAGVPTVVTSANNADQELPETQLCPAFGKRGCGKAATPDDSPLSFYDIVTDHLKAKSTDFVKVTTYHTTGAGKGVQRIDSPAAGGNTNAGISCFAPFVACCASGKSENEGEAAPHLQASVLPPTLRGSVRRADSYACTNNAEPSSVFDVTPGNTERASTGSVGGGTPTSAGSATPRPRYPRVFSRRARSRSASPKERASVLSNCEQQAAGLAECQTKCVEACKEQCGAEDEEEQFTFRGSEGGSPKQADAPPMFKTRVVLEMLPLHGEVLFGGRLAERHQPHAAVRNPVLHAVVVQLRLGAQQTHVRNVERGHHEPVGSDHEVQADEQNVNEVVLSADDVVLALASDDGEEVPGKHVGLPDSRVVQNVGRGVEAKVNLVDVLRLCANGKRPRTLSDITLLGTNLSPLWRPNCRLPSATQTKEGRKANGPTRGRSPSWTPKGVRSFCR
ncbi:uncharacterized protein BcabD6B2_28500 [Babesia caballi]|uniref:Uncharacterized protein n=1 Tax=Babesia caballi TaxID=5871 RepID=A0AAV4LU76_BABCB|nr:hypothetical protein, conserved [Babesia caballi]